MVIRKSLKNKYALVSVYNKKNLKYLCSNLIKHDYKLISSGSTGKKIRSIGFKCIDVSEVTKLKEMFDGRIKTLNPLIYASLLHIRNNKKHRKQFLSLNVPEIDIVVVNLYPFEKYYRKSAEEKIIEMIDIGGPSLLRAASKNFKYITPIVDINDYEKLIKNLEKFDGKTNIGFRKKMASKVFKKISNYDNLIFKWFNE